LVNPITHIDAADPPIFIAHGDQDTTVPLKQSFRLETALTEQNIDHVMRVVVGAGHGFGTQTATVNAEAIAFLSEQLFQPAGDFDRNGTVNGRDFLLWQRQFGSSANPQGSGADGNHDGLVNEADLALWHEHYGEGPDTISALQLPEPSATVLLLFAAYGLALRNIRLHAV
jgi:hypothetical protein